VGQSAKTSFNVPVHCITENVQNEVHIFNRLYLLFMATVVSSHLQ
jgi:hypothetical protein